MIQTKGFYNNPSTEVSRSEPSFSDLGYSVAIPWNDVTTSGWYNYTDDINPTMKMWGQENKMVMRNDPEFYAPGDLIRSTGNIPNINLNDPKYSFSRKNFTYQVY
jgi:hypothetical protein